MTLIPVSDVLGNGADGNLGLSQELLRLFHSQFRDAAGDSGIVVAPHSVDKSGGAKTDLTSDPL